ELRLITEHATQKESGRKTSGILPVTVGFKTNLLQEKGIIPLTSFLGHLTLPHTGRKEFHTTYAAPAFRFAMQHTLSANITLAYNLGAEWDGESPAETYIYSLTNGISISKTLGIYGEFYGYFPTQEKANHFFDCGVTYLINNNCIADFSGGFRLTGNELKNYIALGFSFRADTRGNKR
ncbi:MAG: transporter, partial [Ginsengibacter sp.]